MFRCSPRPNVVLFAVTLLLLAAAGIPHASAQVILSTDFAGRTVSGNTASNITYVTNGVSNPGDLTVSQATGSGLNGLFDTAGTAGFFAPNLNTGNEGNWTFTVPLTLTVSSITIDEVVLDGAMFDNNGDPQVNSPRNTPIELSIAGSASGVVFSDTQTASNPSTGSAWTAPLTYTPSSTLTLTNSETWSMIFTTTAGPSNGNNTGVGSFTVSGTVVPEPGTTWLLGAGLLSLVLRRRR